ncbi:MAG TPA: helix-turn-helix domain-containing protein [Gaiellaceae bacterium]|jgi:AcrR family transcriptional regulator|nr:helix-turn-helix domain-containing protein [Gaiellaceae bacterium]
MSVVSTRLSAAERRQALLDTALRVFSEGSYRGTTTAEIAREAGVSEPILYRHFASKRDLYLACIDEAWRRLRSMWDDAITEASASSEFLPAIGGCYVSIKDAKHRVAEFWMQATLEASDDPEVRRFLRRHMREVRDYVADVIRRCQADGTVLVERDADAEAWVFISTGLLGTIGRRLGGLMDEDDFQAIRDSRREWLTGRS